MNQVLLGAALPYIVCVLLYAIKHGRASWPLLVLGPITMALGALWAIAPDIPRLLGQEALYDRLSRDPRCNTFFWHYGIDQAEVYSPWFTVLVILMIVSLLVAAWREVVRREGDVVWPM